ncbi:MAG TPA: hypothetical protein VK027_04330 [Chitinophagaceae bacterium]|nr:hypothetical protein [Chitinophagaceae bacterium]
MGLEVSGEIIAIGSKVNKYKKGDKVCALLAGGGYAEYVKVDAGSCLKIPRNWTLEEAASLPEVLCTVWMNIFQIASLKKEENVLIYGGSGGIGSFGIQLIRAFGANPYTLAGSKEKLEFCK